MIVLRRNIFCCDTFRTIFVMFRSNHPEVFFGKDVLKICSKFTEEHLCWSVISIKLLCNFIEITHRYKCAPVNFLHIFRTPFPRNNSGWLLLNIWIIFLSVVFILNFYWDWIFKMYLKAFLSLNIQRFSRCWNAEHNISKWLKKKHSAATLLWTNSSTIFQIFLIFLF